MLEAALEYAARGWRILPLAPGAKIPATAHGFKDATTDEETIRKWWTRWPTANIGFATGFVHKDRPTGGESLEDKSTDSSTETDYIFVIDVDPRNGGTIPEGLPTTLSSLTGGGGLHYYFRTTEFTLPSLRRQFSTGVDIKSDGGYIVLPPSRTESEYRWVNPNIEIATAPDWLLDACRRPEISVVVSGESGDPNDTRPGSIFNRTTNWADILTADGWKAVGTNGNETYWCRPGKSEGISATTNYEDSDLLYVFTSNAQPLESNTAYTKFAYRGVVDYGGDFAEAARGLSTQRAMVTTTISRVEKYEFTDAFDSEHFIHRYIQYASKQTDAPREYHESVALGLIATVGYRASATLAPYPNGLRGNLYTLLVGDTTRSRKSTSQSIGVSLLKAVLPGALLPNRATPEALIAALAQRNGGPSMWTPDEFGVTLAGIYAQTFMSGLEGLLLEVYAGNDYTYERSTSPSITIRRPSLSICGAATPESIGRAGATALDSGLLPRFAVVYPKVLPEPRTVTNTPDLAVERSWLESTLRQILTRFSIDTEITFDSQSLQSLSAEEMAFTSTSQSARLPTMLYKVAMLSAIGRQDTIVNVADALSAIAVVNRWKQGIDNLVPMLYRSNSDPQFERRCDYALGLLTDLGGTAPRTEIARVMRVRQQVLDDVEKALLDWGKIQLDLGKGAKVWILN